MNPVSAEDLSELVGVIARWETKRKELERTEEVRLPDMVKMAALTELCPPDMRDLIFQTVVLCVVCVVYVYVVVA